MGVEQQHTEVVQNLLLEEEAALWDHCSLQFAGTLRKLQGRAGPSCLLIPFFVCLPE